MIFSFDGWEWSFCSNSYSHSSSIVMNGILQSSTNLKAKGHQDDMISNWNYNLVLIWNFTNGGLQRRTYRQKQILNGVIKVSMMTLKLKRLHYKVPQTVEVLRRPTSTKLLQLQRKIFILLEINNRWHMSNKKK